jgi:hypothetical protein
MFRRALGVSRQFLLAALIGSAGAITAAADEIRMNSGTIYGWVDDFDAEVIRFRIGCDDDAVHKTSWRPGVGFKRTQSCNPEDDIGGDFPGGECAEWARDAMNIRLLRPARWVVAREVEYAEDRVTIVPYEGGASISVAKDEVDQMRYDRKICLTWK